MPSQGTPDKGEVIQSAPLNDAKHSQAHLWNLEKPFPILIHPLEYSLKTQRDLVLALAVLHNMIIKHTCEPLEFVIDPDEDGAPTGKDDLPPEEEEEPTHSQRREQARNNTWRDQMAQNMWTQYQEYLQSLGRL
ncbi:hypothetical protein MJO29_008324 [Puccinia striiformis f. sp. tritici]|nr:hypothetical protein Pst134EA_015485 [Puccinia striiformis f. sp. tritici]XP_047805248.1 hypothetical protein Pst134EA_015495 [Puccinia striiformis f. sp. tritici]KAH9452655.1 hypothetical protein Pst134EB_016607 [Puccinia striiformis f. sp. tritici]KAH9463402.1 hypothetical protein Pst134EA_015485 [Puccinia striiformis f. sp. tritici]KAH9463412.1 hypothetical protein Pst134EA_015495 [Puccinia striiformis f. sp. tritici]KAI7952693.1 hypothetical protein MJO29_008324 [Puccinia striiformis f.